MIDYTPQRKAMGRQLPTIYHLINSALITISHVLNVYKKNQFFKYKYSTLIDTLLPLPSSKLLLP